MNINATAHKALGLSEVWMMVALGNPLKAPASYAPFDHRLEMCRIMVEEHGLTEIVTPTDIERRIQANQTADVLKSIKEMHPQHHFIWIMGADNLADFHRWSRWQFVMDNIPIAVLARPGKDDDALNSEAARYGASIQIQNPRDLATVSHGWCFIDHHQSLDVSASSILAKLRAGERNVDGLNPKIQDYILSNGLYGISDVAAKAEIVAPHGKKRPKAPRP